MKTIIGLLLLFNIAFSHVGYPLYKQCDAKWASKVLGKGPATICKAGCLLSSVSMALAGLKIKVNGKKANPETVNNWLKSHGGFVGGDEFVWAATDKLGLKFVKFDTAGNAHTHYDAGKHVILNVDAGHHYVLMTGHSGSTLKVNDPGFTRSSYTTS